ncbi:hypothetical protein [Humibacter antri]
MSRRRQGPWFSFTGSNYLPASWQGWVTVLVGVVIVASLTVVGILVSGGQVFH